MANTKDVLGEQKTLDMLVARSLTDFEDDSVNNIRQAIFQYYSNLTHIKLPNLSVAQSQSFAETGITEIRADDFPSLSSIQSSAFNGCEALKKATFNSVNYIGYGAFADCLNLSELFLLKNSVVSIDSRAFMNSRFPTGYGIIYVPRNLVSSYKENSSWSRYHIAAYEDYPDSLGTIKDSWSDILSAEADGTYLTKYKIHDTKFQLIGDYLVDLEIVAFDKDELADGTGKAHITWIAKHVNLSRVMNNGTSYFNGWAGTLLRSNLASMLNESDADFVSAVKQVKKAYYNPTTKTNEIAVDSIWIPSSFELGLSVSSEGSTVTYSDVFNSSNSRIKENIFGSKQFYWTRSTSGSNGYFALINTQGSGTSSSSGSPQCFPIGVCT